MYITRFRGACSFIAFFLLAPLSFGHDIDPWRNGDRTLVQLCFDGLDDSAPQRLQMSSISTQTISSSGLDLIGFTLTKQPVYEGAGDHPTRFGSILVKLPGSAIWAKIDAPSDLKRYIDIWRDVPITLCTADDNASFKILDGGTPAKADCPPGINASLKVASGSEHSLELLHLKARGPSSFNGLRGCRESVYGTGK